MYPHYCLVFLQTNIFYNYFPCIEVRSSVMRRRLGSPPAAWVTTAQHATLIQLSPHCTTIAPYLANEYILIQAEQIQQLFGKQATADKLVAMAAMRLLGA